MIHRTAPLIDCPHCGTIFSIVGDGSGSPEDLAAERRFEDEASRHESRRCSA